MNEENLYEESDIVATGGKERCHIERVKSEDEVNYVFVCLGREGTAYSNQCVQYVLDEATPHMFRTLRIDPDGLKEVVGAIHAQFKESECAGLTGLLNWSTPKNDLWLYQTGNQANSVMSLYGYYFTNYSFKPVEQDDPTLMPLKELLVKVDEFNQDTYCKPVVEIDKERYNEMLGVMPPQRYEGGVFYMSEAQIGDIHSMFAKIDDRYFEAMRDVTKTSNAEFRQHCWTYMSDQEEIEQENRS